MTCQRLVKCQRYSWDCGRPTSDSGWLWTASNAAVQLHEWHPLLHDDGIWTAPDNIRSAPGGCGRLLVRPLKAWKIKSKKQCV